MPLQFLQNYFRDPRYRWERILVVTMVPMAILFVGLLSWLLFLQESKPKQRTSILTADMVEPAAEVTPMLRPVLEARVALQEMDHERARKFLAMPMSTLADQAEALFLEAMIERADNNLPRSLELLDQAVSLQPQAITIFYRGIVQYEAGNLEKAASDFDLAHDLAPSDFLLSNAHFLSQLETGNADLVRRTIELKKNLGLSNTVGSWIVAAAALHLQDGEYLLAAELLQNALRFLPDEHFDLLLNFQSFKKHQDQPQILPFYIKTSTVRQR